MIRVITNFKTADGKSAAWCSNYYRNSHVELARKAFLEFPFIKKFSIARVLRQMEVIKGRDTNTPDVLWFSEIYFDGLKEFEKYLSADTVSAQIQDDRLYASEVNVYVCAEEEVILNKLTP